MPSKSLLELTKFCRACGAPLSDVDRLSWIAALCTPCRGQRLAQAVERAVETRLSRRRARAAAAAAATEREGR